MNFAIPASTPPQYKYEKYKEINPETGRATGFSTPSGKIELYSHKLAHSGMSPCRSTSPRQRMMRSFFALDYRRSPPALLMHLLFVRLKTLRAMHPTPWAETSAETAAEIGTVDGAEVWVETVSGRARFTTRIAVMRSGVDECGIRT